MYNHPQHNTAGLNCHPGGNHKPSENSSTQGISLSQMILSSKHCHGKVSRKRVITQTQRKAANIRERQRMNNMNKAFDSLRSAVPNWSEEKKPSRMETLKLAITYIDYLTTLLQDTSDLKYAADTRSEGRDSGFVQNRCVYYWNWGKWHLTKIKRWSTSNIVQEDMLYTIL